MDRDADNNNETSRIAYLIAAYVRGTLSESEHDELDAWVADSDENMLLFENLTDEANLEANREWMDSLAMESRLRKTKEGLTFSDRENKRQPQKWVYAFAACLIIVVAGYWMLWVNQADKNVLPVLTEDVAPGGNRATLTLADGSVVDMNSLPEGFIKNDGSATIKKTTEGEIVYIAGQDTNNGQARYNILSTPRGGQYKIQLPDGSKVWLNAASSIKYPLVFGNENRSVELEGEAYFDITKDTNRPFIVKLTDGTEVNVLGTEFNVSAYKNEESKLVTLVEGKVKVNRNGNDLVLAPRQQAKLNLNSIELIPDVDLDEAVGWKDGEFVFHDADIKAIMRQVERWYDAEVKYNTEVSERFNATISRNLPVSRLLEILEKTDKIHFKIENKTIYVLP